MRNARTFTVALLLTILATAVVPLTGTTAARAETSAESPETIERSGRQITLPKGSHYVGHGMPIWSSGNLGYLLTDSTGNEGGFQALIPDQIVALDLDTGAEVARSTVASLGADRFHGQVATDQVVIDEAGGKLYAALTAPSTECGLILVCMRRIAVFDAGSLQLEKTIALAAAAGTFPQLDALTFSPPRSAGDKAKLHLLISDMPAPGGGEKTLQERNNIVRAVQIDPASGATDWALDVAACTNTRFPGFDQLANRAAIFRAPTPTTEVYVGCHGSSALAQVVRISVDDANPLASTQASFAGPRFAARIIGDPASTRLLVQSSTGNGTTLWVFDGRRSVFVGVIGLGSVSATAPGVGFDPDTGRLYAFVPPTEASPSAPATPGGLLVVDARRTPLPQASTFSEFASLADDASNHVVPVSVRSARPGRDRLVLFRAGATRDGAPYEVIVDRLPISQDIPPDDPDRLTVDVPEADGVTSSNYEGAVRGYGLRSLLVGGYGAAARTSVTDISALYDARLGETRIDPWGDCGRRDREAVFGSAGPARSSGETATAEARAVAFDVTTGADLDEPTARCAGTATPVTLPSFEQAACVSPDEDPDKVDPDPVTGPLPAAEADVGCGDHTSGRGVAKVAAIGPVTVGEASSTFTVYRDPTRGVVTRVESLVRNVDIGGVVQIEGVWAAAESWANGRKQPAAVAADPNCDLTRTSGTCLRRVISGVVINGERHSGSPEDEASLIAGMQRALGREFVIRQRQPDPKLAAGSPGGYVAGLQKPADEQFADAALNNDALLTLPTLEVVRLLDGAGGRGRQVFQFAGVEISSTYGIELLPTEPPPPPGSLEISLADGDGEPLAGGIFKVHRDGDGDGAVGLLDEVIPEGTCVTAEDGVGGCTFAEVEPGSYVIQQVAAPAGYQLSPDLPLTLGPGEAALARFTNLRAVGAIAISLTDDSDPAVPLAGSTFKVFGDDGDGVVSAGDKEYGACTTDANGECTFDEVPLGAYVVHHEVPAPDHLAADDAAFELAVAGETARLAFVTGLTAIEGERGIDDIPAEDAAIAVEDAPTDTTTVEIEEGVPVPLPTVETVANVTEPPAKSPSLVRRVLGAPVDVGRFLARHPREALAFAAVWAVLLGAGYLVLKRRKAAALIAATAPRPLFDPVSYLSVPGLSVPERNE